MKKIISLILTALIVLSLSATAFAAEKTVERTESWKITASSDQGKSVEKAFDGDEATYWHTAYEAENGQVTSHDECPHTVTVDFGATVKISGWEYTPRNDNGTGTVLKHNIYASEDGKTFKLIYSDDFGYEGGDAERLAKKESWGDVSMKAIKIEVVSSLGGYGTAAEIKFFTGGTGTAIKDGAVYSEDKKDEVGGADSTGRCSSDGTPFMNKTGWTAEVNSDINSTLNKILDGDTATYWHSHYVAVGSEIQSHDNPPYHLKVTLPEAVLTSGIVLTPRQDSANGRMMGADIYISDTDNGEWFLIKEGESYDPTSNPREIRFTANLKIKRVWVEITSSQGGYGTLGEFDLMVAKDDYEEVAYKDYAAHEEENKLYEISVGDANAEYYGENWVGNIPNNIFDGADQTFWQTAEIKSNEWPVVLTVDLKDNYNLSEIRYLPRQSDDCHGAWLDITVNGSSDGEDWVVLNEGVELSKDLLRKTILLDNAENIRYVELQINMAHASRVSCAELSFWQTKNDRDGYLESKGEKYVMKIGSKTIESTKGKNENTTELDVAPYIVNGSTMIPLRGLLEEMGADISWNADNETITIDNGANVITLQIWSYLVYVEGTKYGDLRYTLLNPPIISESRTFVPIRFISEQLGYSVTWDGDTQTITIEK